MIDQTTVKARVEEFHRRHGGVCYSDECNWFYADGAYRDVNPYGVLADPLPPTRDGKHRNAENIVTFHKLKLAWAARKFDELDFRLSSTCPSRPEEALKELKELQALVTQCKRELAQAQTKLDATEIEQYRKQVKRRQEEEKQQFQRFQKQRTSIRI